MKTNFAKYVSIQELNIYGVKKPFIFAKLKIRMEKKIKINTYVNNTEVENLNYTFDDNFVIISGTLPNNMVNLSINMVIDKKEFCIFNKRIGFFRRLFNKICKKHSFIEQKSLFLDPFDTIQYNEWINLNEKFSALKKLNYNPKFSICVPVFNVSEIYLRECIESVISQTYSNWELCIADDCSSDKNVKKVLDEYKKKDDRIKIFYRKKNGGISEATNSAFDISTGDYIALLDNDDVLSENALYEVALKLNENKNYDFIYSDEDKLDIDGNRCIPYFKPDWSPNTFLSNNYICHFTVFSSKLLKKVGYERKKYDGAQDYDLFLRLTEVANSICHIDKILYHWRIIPGSTSDSIMEKEYAILAGQNALKDALKRRNINGDVESFNNGIYSIKYKIKNPLVSIIIPTKDYADTLDVCLKSIYNLSTYRNFEIVVIDNGSVEVKTKKLLNSYQEQYNNFRVLDLNCEFNYSYLNNYAVQYSFGDYLLFLNNDIEVISPDWIEKMVMYASQNNIGAVGVKLLFPDETVQHGGIVNGINNVAGHAYAGRSRNDWKNFGRLNMPCDVGGVTAACMMVEKNKFNAVNGFDENLAVNYNDVDFNLKLLDKGYNNVYLGNVELFHYESKSRGKDTTPEKFERTKRETEYIIKKWKNKISKDKYYNSNYSYKNPYMLER